MTPIKYRAWNKASDKMEKVISIWVLNDEISSIVIKKGDSCDTIFKDYELMQSTGLEDQNGKEIFEGDIIQYRRKTKIGEVVHNWIVFWDDKTARFRIKMGDETNSLFQSLNNGHILVGNIYENKDLI